MATLKHLEKMNYEQERVYSELSNDPQNTTKRHELRANTGWGDEKVRKIVKELLEFVPVVAKMENGGGYWIATTSDEINFYINDIMAKIKGLENVVDLLELHKKALIAQGKITNKATLF